MGCPPSVHRLSRRRGHSRRLRSVPSGPWERGLGRRGLPWAWPLPPREQRAGGSPRRPLSPRATVSSGRAGVEDEPGRGPRASCLLPAVSGAEASARPLGAPGSEDPTLPGVGDGRTGARGAAVAGSRRGLQRPSHGECSGPRPLAPLRVWAGPPRSPPPRPRRSWAEPAQAPSWRPSGSRSSP